jgi:hypothetical protein
MRSEQCSLDPRCSFRRADGSADSHAIDGDAISSDASNREPIEWDGYSSTYDNHPAIHSGYIRSASLNWRYQTDFASGQQRGS